MAKKLDLTGQTYGRLTVIREVEPKIYPCGDKKSRWLCKCTCGNTKVVCGADLRSGDTKSCGCWEHESKTTRSRTHGGTGSVLYRRWVAMRKRCNNPHNREYDRYGGRGIKVCDEWQDYAVFKEWALSHGYSPELSLDRIDVNGNYCPENCRFVDMTTRARNRTNNIFVEYHGKRYTLPELVELTGIHYSTLYQRVKRGFSIEDIVGVGKQRLSL